MTAARLSLESATEKMNVLLRRAERVFASLKLGVSATVTIEGGHQLSFCKDSNEWKFMVSTGLGVDADDWTEIPLLHAARATRVVALKALPELHCALLGQLDLHAREIEHEIKEAEEFLDSLERG